MNDQVDDKLDLLDLDEDNAADALPEVESLSVPRPKRPWLLMGVGIAVIILATFIIVHTVSKDSTNMVQLDLDAPVVTENAETSKDTKDIRVPAKKVEIKEESKKIETIEPKNEESVGVPVKIVKDRNTVTFNPDKTSKTVKQDVKKTKINKPIIKKSVSSSNGAWYVQFGSYSTRALAEAAEKKIKKGHDALFVNKQFVILAAVLPNGQTTYRLRIAFSSSADANGFCRNAKSDGLECYVAK